MQQADVFRKQPFRRLLCHCQGNVPVVVAEIQERGTEKSPDCRIPDRSLGLPDGILSASPGRTEKIRVETGSDIGRNIGVADDSVDGFR